MSLLTRCPACTTIFRVVPDQLKISQGWVKCGQCGDIFDANQHLVHLEPQSSPEADQTPGPEAQRLVEDEPFLVETGQTVAELPFQESLGAEAKLPSREPSVLPSEAVEQVDGALPAIPEELDSESPGLPRVASDPDDEQTSEAVQVEPSQALVVTEAPAKPDDAAPANSESRAVSFLRESASPRWVDRLWARLILWSMALVLLLGLWGQWVYRERDALLAAQPQLQPALELFCQVLNCRLSALQRIDALVIDSTDFKQSAPERYRLRLTVKNTAAVSLAAPSIELTLTDLQDQVVVRRVFLAQEFDAQAHLLSAGAEWPVSLALGVHPNAARKVVGYRVRLFYP